MDGSRLPFFGYSCDPGLHSLPAAAGRLWFSFRKLEVRAPVYHWRMDFLTIVMFFIARTPDFQVYYGAIRDNPAQLIFKNAMDLFGWEFVFRGLLLFTLLPICGPYAIILQAVPFTIAHFGKPELETISCIFGGTIFGYIGWRTRSFLYPFLIHWYLTTITILLARSFM